MALANGMRWTVVKKNAAAYTNIDTVRTEIASYAITPNATLAWFLGEDDPHYCFMLDEADHIPIKAQAALRGLMEEAAKGGHCDFVLTANDGSKIDPAIRSRCAVFDIGPT